MKAEVKGATTAVIIDHLKGQTSTLFFPFAYSFIEKQSYNTGRNVRTEVNKFREWVKNEQLAFADITTATLYTYHEWIIKTNGNSLNTANKGLSKLRTSVGQWKRGF